MLDPFVTDGDLATLDQCEESANAGQFAERDTGDAITRRFEDGENVAPRPRLICMGFGIIRI